MTEIRFGVHTYSVGMTLTAAQYYQIKQRIGMEAHRTSADFWSEETHDAFDGLRKQGIWVYLSKIGTIYRIKVRIEPCRVLREKNPAALYQPDKRSYRRMVKQADALLKAFSVPRSIDQMKISRADVTCDLTFEDASLTEVYVRTLQKAYILPHYQRVSFRKKDGKVKNAREANRHSYKQQCKNAAFFAYDKTAQLQMTGRLAKDFIHGHILRLEAELNREALKKHLGKENTNFQFLKKGAKQAKDLVRWYLKRMFKGRTGKHLRYAEAVRMVELQGWKRKTKNRVLYLLRKLSDSESMNVTIQKTQEKFQITPQTVKHLLKKLSQADINPITLPNKSPYTKIPDLQDMI